MLLSGAEAYILEHIYLGMRVEGLRRVDMPEIAREAFRFIAIFERKSADVSALAIEPEFLEANRVGG